MTKQQEALRLAGRFLRALANGADASPAECKAMSDLCFIVLPMKYRLSKEEVQFSTKLAQNDRPDLTPPRK